MNAPNEMSRAEVLAAVDHSLEWHAMPADHPPDPPHEDLLKARITIANLFEEVERLRKWQFDLSESLGFCCAAGATWTTDQIFRGLMDEEQKVRRQHAAELDALRAERDTLKSELLSANFLAKGLTERVNIALDDIDGLRARLRLAQPKVS